MTYYTLLFLFSVFWVGLTAGWYLNELVERWVKKGSVK